MPTVKVSEMSQAGAIGDGDLLAGVQGGASVAFPASLFAPADGAAVQGALRTSSPLNRSNDVTLTADPYLSFPVVSGQVYTLRTQLRFFAGAGGLRLDMLASGGGLSDSNVIATVYDRSDMLEPIARKRLESTDYGTPITIAGGVDLDLVVIIEGTVLNAGNGALAIAWAQNTDSAEATTRAGAGCYLAWEAFAITMDDV